MGEYRGRIDECSGGVVAGWAASSEPGENPVTLEVVVEDQVVAAGTADLFREDLRAAGLGDGRHAFQFNLPLTVGRLPKVSVRVRVQGTSTELDGSPLTLNLWAPGSPHRFRAHFDEPEGTRLTGWVIDTHDPARTLDLQLFADDELAGAATCGVDRPDVAATLGDVANVACGFAVDVAERFCEGREHEFRLDVVDAPVDTRVALRARFALDRAAVGHVDRLQRGRLVGWAVDPERSGPALLDVFVDGVRYAQVEAAQRRRDGAAISHNGFEIDFGLVPLFGKAVEVDVRFAGSDRVLKNSPIRLDFSRFPKPPVTSVAARPLDRPISVVVPIHDGFEAVEPCLAALFRFASPRARIILIDDCSTDRRIRLLLAKHKGFSNVLLRRNEVNQGYTKTVNLGLSLAGDDDVILLNSDTIVGPRWIEHLALAAAAAPDVGTVTAISDNAGAFSVPEGNRANPLPLWLDSAGAARLAAQIAHDIHPGTPTGNGFCMYIRRAMLRDVGTFDEKAFPRGYGEENDLCMRALRVGWRHVVQERCLVRHARSVSFGAERETLLARARSLLAGRYPDYSVLVQRFVESPHLRFVRHRVRSVWEGQVDLERPPRPRILFVISTLTGGTPQTTRDLLRSLRHLYHPFLLTCDAQIVRLFDCDTDEEVQQAEHRLTMPIHLTPHASGEYDETVRRLIVQHAIELVHIRHIAWHGLGLPRVVRELGLPVVFSFHDFYAVCPTVNLIDDKERFCAGVCSSTGGDCTVELWKRERLPPLKNAFVNPWREMMAKALAECDAFVTTSPGAKSLILQFFPQLAEKPFPVIRHGRDFPDLRGALQLGTNLPERTRPIRILCPGNLGVSKGARLVRAVKALDREQRLEFHFLGDIHHELRDVGHVHGRYERGDFHRRVAEIRPHFVGLFSIWPETFSHTLTEAWASGIPVVASGLGALGERIRECGGGWLLDDLDPEAVYRVILDAAASPQSYLSRLQEIVRWQRLVGRVSGTAHMSVAYHDLYRACLVGAEARDAAPPARCLRIAHLARETQAGGWNERWQDWRMHRDFAAEIGLVPFEIESLLDMEQVGDLDAVLVDPTAVPQSLAAALASRCAGLGLPLILTESGDRPALSEAAALVSRLPPGLPEFAWFGPLAGGHEPIAPPPADTVRLLCVGVDPDAIAFLDSVCEMLQARISVELLVLGTATVQTPRLTVLPVPDFGGDRLRKVRWFRAVAATCDIALDFRTGREFDTDRPGFLEFAAAGLPGIFSRSATGSDLVRHRANGFLADNIAADWMFWLEPLCHDVAMRRQIADAARKTVVDRHLMRDLAPLYVEAFRAVAVGAVPQAEERREAERPALGRRRRAAAGAARVRGTR